MRKASGVLAVYRGKLCIIRASGGKGWTIPKGGVEKGLTRKESAAKEAFEEAGLIGHIKDKVGDVVLVKQGVLQQIAVFSMVVSMLSDKYPEKKRRDRKFVNREEALKKLPAVYHELVRNL